MTFAGLQRSKILKLFTASSVLLRDFYLFAALENGWP